MHIKLVALSILAMTAFAANSILCRLALLNSSNSPLSFTLIRLSFGAFALSFFYFKHTGFKVFELKANNFIASLVLFVYALFFSISYVQMEAGVGALILFASVQITMMLFAFLKKQKLTFREKIGVLITAVGFTYLLLPGLGVPPLFSAFLMMLSGVAWGVYSLLGQNSLNPTMETTRNFILTFPLVCVLFILFPFKITLEGFYLAALSGAITSGLGYVLWYAVLRDLRTSNAAIIQLSVPAIAALGGVVFIGEALSLRLIVSSSLIFIGIFIKIYTFNVK